MIKKEGEKLNLYWKEKLLFDVLQDSIEIMYENSDRSLFGKEVFDCWKTEKFEENRCIISSEKWLAEINVVVRLTVTYQVRSTVIEKQVTCYQNHAPNLYLGITQHITCPEAVRVWSFDGEVNKESCIYGGRSSQPFPTAGFTLSSGTQIGILMDTGIANEWSRWHLRRTSGGNAPVVSAYDPVLIGASSERKEVTLYAGQYEPTYEVPLDGDSFQAIGWGRKGYRYLLEYDVRQTPCKFRIRLEDGTVLEQQCTESGRGVFRIPKLLQNESFTVSCEEGENWTSLRLFEQKPEAHPWHRLSQGYEKSYRYFYFVDSFEPSLRNIRKTAQIRLAEALGFTGTSAEKILYADFRMLNWVAEPDSCQPLCVPSIDYFEMYFRDVFWSVNGVNDRELNTIILHMIERTMDERGWVDNVITPFFGSIEKTDNEINYLYLIWNYLNQKRFGILPDQTRLEKVTHLLLDRYDPDRTGVIKINNPQSLMDVMWQEEPSYFAVSQGYYCVAMRTALAFGITGIDAAYVEKTKKAYQNYARVRTDGKEVLQTFPENHLGEEGENREIVSCLDLEPEFLSLYLFGESLLGSKIVVDTLESIPVYGECLMPIIAYADGTFFSKEKNPFNGGLFWEAGRYANGGSYLRPQYIALATGKYHGWKRADQLMKARLKAEMETCADDPVSMEYLHTLGDPKKSSTHKVFAWNVFVIQINRWIRETLDPEFYAGEDIQ
ncbi:MAG: hypothetical protein ACI4EG_08570 [Fusicatenibacter sp.]